MAFRNTVLVHAPLGRDAELTVRILSAAGVAASAVPAFPDLLHWVQTGNAGAVLVTAEAFSAKTLPVFAEALSDQPHWSDLPVLVFVPGGRESSFISHLEASLASLPNLSLLERPIRAATLVSVVKNALRSRSRQYEVQRVIEDKEQGARSLEAKTSESERQEAEIESVYQTAPIGLALFDPVEFRYLRLNATQAEFFGMKPEAILGKRVTDLAPIEGVWEMFEQVAAGHPVINSPLEGELVGRPGEYRYWTVNYFPVYDHDGRIQAITAASLEITQQKKAELALIQSEKLAAVGRLASSISHEINNPLEAITNLLYIMAGQPELTEDTKQLVSTAQSELARVSQIATQTLKFHRQRAQASAISAMELIDPVIILYQGRLHNSHIAIEKRYLSEKPLLCLENELRQVLNNLIGNAIDAMRTGGRLLVRAREVTSRGKACLCITVADSGTGMNAETLKRIFEPFFTTKDINGNGLGLWISLEIVMRHHGCLEVRSSVGERHGTVFRLVLPFEESRNSQGKSCIQLESASL